MRVYHRDHDRRVEVEFESLISAQIEFHEARIMVYEKIIIRCRIVQGRAQILGPFSEGTPLPLMFSYQILPYLFLPRYVPVDCIVHAIFLFVGQFYHELLFL